MDNDAIALFKQQYDDTRRPFEEGKFRTARRDEWDVILERRDYQNLPEQIRAYARNIDIQSPRPMADLNDYTAIAGLCPTRLDLIPLDQAIEAKRDIVKIKQMLGATIRYMDEEADVSENRFKSMYRYGVDIEFLCWRRDDEPDIWGDWDGDNYAELCEEAVRKLDARDKGCRAQDAKNFRIRFPSVLSCCWGPKLDRPDMFFEDVVIPYSEAVKLANANGEKLRLDANGKVVFMGTPEPKDNASLHATKLIHVLRQAKRIEDTDDWTLLEYVYPEGKFGDGECLLEYDCPLGRCPYFITESGDANALATDPHLRYWPGKMHGLYVLYHERNFLRTLIAALAFKAALDENIYVNTSKMTEEQISRYTDAGLLENVGARTRLKIERARVGSGEITVSPQLDEYPPVDLTKWNEQLQVVDAEIRRLEPPRNLLGKIEEVGETASLGLAKMQGSALPFGGDLKRSDRTTADIAGAILHCYMEWDEDRPYRFSLTGKEKVKGTIEIGAIVVSVETLKKREGDFIIDVESTAETKQERDLRIQYAMQRAYMPDPPITKVELYEEMGYDDPYQHEEDLAEQERWEKSVKPTIDKAIDAAAFLIMQASTGVDFASLAPSASPVPQSGLTPGSATQGPMGGQDGPREPVTAPVVQGPTGGSSGFAGVR